MNFNDTSNIWAYKGQGKTFLFCGHTDVVHPGDIKLWKFPPFLPTINKGFLFGRGAVDMKGALSSMLIATKNFVKKYPTHKGRLAFLITSDEEASGLNGTQKVIKKLKNQNEKIEYCLVGEPTSKNIVGDIIKNGRRGSLTVYLNIYGIQGHVAYPKISKNPIHEIIPFLNELILTKLDNGNKYFSRSNIQIVNIQTNNISSNLIPNKCTLEINIRFNNELTEKKIQSYIINLLKKYNINYSIKWNLFGLPFITKKNKLLNIVIKSIKYKNKEIKKPKINTDGGTSDGRFIANIDTEVIELGLVNSTIHKINECVKIQDLKILSLIYQDILEKLML